VADAAQLSGALLTAVFSESADQLGQSFSGLPIQLLDAETQVGNFHLCIGDNAARARLYALLSRRGSRAVVVRHPAAIVAATANLDAGCFVAAGAILAPRSRIGVCTIINHGAVVDHDVQIGEFVHVAPGATLGGGVRLGDRVLLGAGAVILPGLSIGAGAIIGAGAVVLEDVSQDVKVVGVPARKI